MKAADAKATKENNRHRAKNLEMGDNYRLRVGAFIKKMIQEPKIVEDELTGNLNN